MINGIINALDRFINSLDDDRNDDYDNEEEMDEHSFMKGKEMIFRCYWKVVRTKSGEKGVLVDSHDNLIVLPEQDSNTYEQDARTLLSAIRAARNYSCVERNGDRRIEVVGIVQDITDSYLILSDISYTYKQSPLNDADRGSKGTIVIDANRR